MHTTMRWEYLWGSNEHEDTEKTFYNNQQNTLREVYTEKYDHNVVVKANPTYPSPELRTAYPAIEATGGVQDSKNCRRGKISITNSKIETGFM